MHVQSKWAIASQIELLEFIDTYSFASLIDKHFDAAHLPLVLETKLGRHVLTGHLPRNNPLLKNLEDAEVLVIFNGPHSYISPYWYGESPAVPTWNYAAVHVKGRARLLTETQTQASLEAMLHKYEPKLLNDDKMYTQQYRNKLIKGITGISIEIEHIEGKEKLGQHKSPQAQKGTVQGLTKLDNPDAVSLLNYMNKRGLGLGDSDD